MEWTQSLKRAQDHQRKSSLPHISFVAHRFSYG
jgi:hypothetical protein